MKVLIKHISKFFIVGVMAVLVDLVTYYVFSSFLPIDISKMLGFICGSTFTYYLNKIWTWRHKEKTNKDIITRFALIYGVSLVFNVLINKYALLFLPSYYFSATLTDTQHLPHATTSLAAFKVDKFLAFLSATVFSAVFNFLGQKLWVFKQTPDLVVLLQEEEVVGQ